MAWIKFDKDLVNDPRIIRAAGGLAERYTLSVERAKGDGFAIGNDLSSKESTELMRNAVIGALVTLWVYADTHIRNGDVLPISMDDINQMVGIEGFCEMLGPDWIQETNFGVFTVLPGYCEKNGLLSREKRRSTNAERQRRYRARHNASRNDDSNAVTSNAVTLLDQDLDQDLDQKKKSRGHSARRGSRLPAEWTPSGSLEEWASKERPDLDIPATVEKFKDHFRAAPGSKGVKLDWEATFRNWVRAERAPLRAAAPDYSAVIANLKD